MKKKRKKWDSTRIFNIHKNLYVILNLIIWLNMLIVLGIMNPDIPFSAFEKFVMDSMAFGVMFTTILILHYIIHNRYLASKWEKYRQQGVYNMNLQIQENSADSNDFSRLEDHYKNPNVDSTDEPIELKNGNLG